MGAFGTGHVLIRGCHHPPGTECWGEYNADDLLPAWADAGDNNSGRTYCLLRLECWTLGWCYVLFDRWGEPFHRWPDGYSPDVTDVSRVLEGF